MRFLVDAQLPPALARWLSTQGHEAEHVADLEMLRASDAEIWEKAISSDAIIISKDEDFALRRNTSVTQKPAVVWLRVGNTRNQELIRWFEQLLPRITASLEAGEHLIEVV